MEKSISNQNKWGSKNKFIFKPNWARWKLHLQITATKWREYYSYDYHNVYVDGIKTKAYRERLSLIDMIARVRESNPSGYKYGNVFANFTNDLSTSKKNFNFHVFSMTPIKCNWKQEIFYTEDPIPGSGYIDVRVNVRKTMDFLKLEDQIKPADPKNLYQSREAMYRMLDKALDKMAINTGSDAITEIQAKNEIDRILKGK